MPNRDEDDKEEERPEELDDQLDLSKKRTQERLQMFTIISPLCVSICLQQQTFFFFNFCMRVEKCDHLVSPAVCDVLPEQ